MDSSRRGIYRMLGSFLVGVAIALMGPRLVNVVLGQLFFSKARVEIARVTSPNGSTDAVMTKTDCGAPCSSEYRVYIVPKGGKAPTQQQSVFFADDLVEQDLEWRESHLLQIKYRQALIHEFSNITYPFGEFGRPETWQYAVEIRLAPFSPDFSYLKNGGLP